MLKDGMEVKIVELYDKYDYSTDKIASGLPKEIVEFFNRGKLFVKLKGGSGICNLVNEDGVVIDIRMYDKDHHKFNPLFTEKMLVEVK